MGNPELAVCIMENKFRKELRKFAAVGWKPREGQAALSENTAG
jgi:hypothetical protein